MKTLTGMFRTIVLTAPFLFNTSLSYGVTYDEVMEVVKQGIYDEKKLPMYKLSDRESLFDSVVNDSFEVMNDPSDYTRHPKVKLVHPNGIVLTGTWKITENTKYTGYFAKGSEGLAIVRASVFQENPVFNPKLNRGFSMAIKIFPTLDPHQPVTAANVFLSGPLEGIKNPNFLNAVMDNEPKLNLYKVVEPKDIIVKLAVRFAATLMDSFKHPFYRPVYGVSELGGVDAKKAKFPMWVELAATPGQPRLNEPDMRKELDVKKYPGKKITFDIYAMDELPKGGKAPKVKIGQLILTESIASFGGDQLLKFMHDPNVNQKTGKRIQPVDSKF